ncbi:MAG: DUF1788 domain-containing protein [Defluviitaleaceae bacterium]|nr:DUF1788 domain-containing protein [Defluviitaleaceae bacterium]
MLSLSKRLDFIESKILDKNFRTGRGTVGELNFWIFDYPPEDEMAVRDYIGFIVSRINGRYDDISIKCFDLYDLMIQVLREKGYLDKVMEREASKGSTAIFEPIKKTLRLTQDRDLIIAKITENIVPEKDVIFITGVGKAWPIIRSHTILNNLHSKVEKNPLVMFFPGEYTNELKLFGEITDDNYYRAFKLV